MTTTKHMTPFDYIGKVFMTRWAPPLKQHAVLILDVKKSKKARGWYAVTFLYPSGIVFDVGHEEDWFGKMKFL